MAIPALRRLLRGCPVRLSDFRPDSGPDPRLLWPAGVGGRPHPWLPYKRCPGPETRIIGDWVLDLGIFYRDEADFLGCLRKPLSGLRPYTSSASRWAATMLVIARRP